ncbi:RICIN domain-containing protein [Streptomyces griseoruber]|uniref:RICIN domain-containing protein n=1 Tax=Streptomyces griseoruber TaxID=1943 RepID=UPI0006E26D8B|nr:RICIN domain-containing protein [Streptomyces griseoruber]
MSEHLAQQAPHHPQPGPGILPEHAPAVHAYAEAFCAKPRDATDLAAQVLARGPRQPGPALRTALLADVRRTAHGWLRDERSALLRPEFRAWSRRAADTFGPVDTLRRVEHGSVLLAAFEQLSDQSRAALWLCLAEEGESAQAARLLNTTEEFAGSLAQSARGRLVDTVLRVRADRTADPRCVHYGGMLGAIARGTHREAPADLRQHLDICRFCAHDLRLLRTLASGGAQEARRLLVDQVLVWGGAAYRRARSAGRAPAAAGPAGRGPAEPPAAAREHPVSRPPGRRRRRTACTVAVTVVLTAVLTTAVLRELSGSDPAEGAEQAVAEAGAASPSASSASPASAAPVVLRSAANGRCVTGPAGSAASDEAQAQARTRGPVPAPDPVLAACDGGEDQQWRVVALEDGAVALVNVASRLCLDIAGERVAGDGMQQRPCANEQADAPFPEDQAFLAQAAGDDAFALVCQDNPDIALGVRSGKVRMRSTAAVGKAVRFSLDGVDDTTANALGL